MKANCEIRNECRKHGIKLWELAAWIGISEATMTRKLRQELPSEQHDHILNMIRKLAEHKAEQEADYQARRGEYSGADNADG